MAKPLKKTTSPAPSGDTTRPVTVTIHATFPEGGRRRVVPDQLERAAEAAAAAFRASLESRRTPYEIEDLDYTLDYNYRIIHRRGRL